MPRHKIEFDYDYNFLLFGICSNAKDYRLAWIINKSLNLRLKRKEDIVVSESNRFAFFTFEDEANGVKYILAANKSTGNIFMKELKQMDYLLIADGNYKYLEEENFLMKLKNSESVLAAYKLNAEVLKSKQHLLFQ